MTRNAPIGMMMVFKFLYEKKGIGGRPLYIEHLGKMSRDECFFSPCSAAAGPELLTDAGPTGRDDQMSLGRKLSQKACSGVKT